MTVAIRLAKVAAVVAVMFGLAVGPRPDAEAAGSGTAVSITRFCGATSGSAESATIKLSITLKNLGPGDVQGNFVAWSVAMAPAVNPYFYLTTHGTVVLHPGQSVKFVASGTGINLARTTRFAAGVGNVYAYTPWYMSPQEIPAC